MRPKLARKLALLAALMLIPSAMVAEEKEADAYYTDFKTFTQGDWYISDFAIKNESMVTAWGYNQVHLTDDQQLELSLDPAPINTGKRFNGAEVQKRAHTYYGRYEVVMKPARGEGVISAFFTYTGPWFKDPHDEIDFEFLGRDTTKVWVTRFADGERLPGQWIDLGFDAADQLHLYAFEWTPEHLVWFVNGEEIMRVDASDRTLPTTPSRIYLSIWAGGETQREWAGVAPRDTRAVATFSCISYVPLDETNRQCSDEYSQLSN